MIVVTKNKREKKYVCQETPGFHSRYERAIFNRRQNKQEAIQNIKSVSVQVKDIKKMVYSDSVPLQSFSAKFEFIRANSSVTYNDDDYITIRKKNNSNGSLIYALITEDWLINKEELKNKTIEELNNECNLLKKEILRLSDIYENSKPHSRYSVKRRFKLLQYKLSCLEECCKNIAVICQNSKQYNNLLKGKTRKRVLL